MPKLSPENTKAVQKAADEGGGLKVLPIGKYELRLTEVEAKTSNAGSPMWVWKFEVNEGEHAGFSLWEYTVIQENAMWKLAQVFDAFGSSPDVNTDDLIGQTVTVMVDQRVIGAGKRKGELGNEISEYFSADNKDAGDTASSKAGSSDDLPF